MFVLILRQNLQGFAKFFLSLIDCLITPKREKRVIGDLDVETFLLIVGDLDAETFLLIVSIVLERAEDKLVLILIVVTPLRTTDVGAKLDQ